MIAPFHGLAVSQRLKEMLDICRLNRIEFKPVANGNNIWKLGSSLILPRSETRIQDGNGAFVDADDWSGQWSEKYFDDEGYIPPEIAYRKSVMDGVPDFDVAMTFERTGVNNRSAFRWIVVTQKFRETLNQFDVPDVTYVPVRLV